MESQPQIFLCLFFIRTIIECGIVLLFFFRSLLTQWALFLTFNLHNFHFYLIGLKLCLILYLCSAVLGSFLHFRIIVLYFSLLKITLLNFWLKMNNFSLANFEKKHNLYTNISFVNKILVI
jgi:hypothetical protein